MSDAIDLDITVVPPKNQEDGFIDWYDTDVTNGFHVYADDELADILKHKAEKHVHYDELPILQLYFRQGSAAAAADIPVDLNNPLHEELKWELDFLDRETGKDRKNALARICSIAKKMGMKACKSAKGRKVLATDIQMVWQEQMK